METHKDREKEK